MDQDEKNPGLAEFSTTGSEKTTIGIYIAGLIMQVLF